MARVVEEGLGNSRRVRWEEFTDGRAWELRRGVDFDQDPERARRAAITWAYRHEIGVRTSVTAPDRLRVQFYDRRGHR